MCDGFITDPNTNQQFVNLWRLGAFVGGNLDVGIEKNDLNTMRDWIGQGAPLILGLAMSNAMEQYVVATGVAADGSITIMDPNTASAKTNLNDYVGTGTATLDQVIRLIPHAPQTTGFLVVGKTPATISSPAGLCGTTVKLNPGLNATRCDGTLGGYQLEANDQTIQLTVTDLGKPANTTNLTGTGDLAFRVFQSGGVWTASPQQLSFTASSIVNAASFTPALAPGSLFSVFGTGMTGTTTVSIGGAAATIVGETPFQINAQVPPGQTPGTLTIKIVSPYGSLDQPITIQPTAPAIFSLTASQAAIINQDGSLNTSDNPLSRGAVLVIFCTGLGVTSAQGSLQTAVTPVSVVLGGASLQPAFAGLTPGFIGLYQVNVQIPQSTPPGLSLPLQLEQGGATSNTVSVSIQ